MVLLPMRLFIFSMMHEDVFVADASQQLLDYTIRNGAFAIFPLTPAFTVTGLGNPAAHSSIVMAKYGEVQVHKAFIV